MGFDLARRSPGKGLSNILKHEGWNLASNRFATGFQTSEVNREGKKNRHKENGMADERREGGKNAR